MKVQINKVIVKSQRQRQTYTEGGMIALKDSMAKFGQLHPLIVIRILDNSEEAGECDCGRPHLTESNPHTAKCSGTFYLLVSGERRLTAARELGWNWIEIKEKPNATPLELEEIELDENLCREDLTWQEEVAAKKRVWEIRAELYGETAEQVALHVGISKGSLADDARLARVMEEIPELAQSKNKSQAMGKLRLLEKKVILTELARRQANEVLEPGVIDFRKKVLKGDCLELIKGVQDESISLVLTDPPYGINLDMGGTKKDSLHLSIYDDDPTEIMELVERVASEAFRVLRPDSHCYLWFDIKAYSRVLSSLSKAGFTVDPIPLIWVKNRPGQTNHPDIRWASAYETCFYCRKGKRPLLTPGKGNALIHPVLEPSQKIHPTEKPISLLVDLIEASTVEGEVVLDFFGGSGSTAEAAIRTNRDFLLFELDENYHSGILARLNQLDQE